jgi:hypothetical protein
MAVLQRNKYFGSEKSLKRIYDQIWGRVLSYIPYRCGYYTKFLEIFISFL